jgi:hypothetical protein
MITPMDAEAPIQGNGTRHVGRAICLKNERRGAAVGTCARRGPSCVKAGASGRSYFTVSLLEPIFACALPAMSVAYTEKV